MNLKTSPAANRTNLLMLLWMLGAMLCAVSPAWSQPILTGGLRAPVKMDRSPGGNLLVTETGTGAMDGRVSLVAGFGARFTLLDGLPSGFTPEGVSGPTAVADAHSTLYILIGEGDVLQPSMPPAQTPNQAGLSSAYFSSLLRAQFSPVPDGIRQGFTLTAEDHRQLADGRVVVLTNEAQESVELMLLADFRDLEPDPRTGVRQANPFGLAISGSLTADDLAELGYAGRDIETLNFLARLEPDSAIGQRLRERTVLYTIDPGMNTLTRIEAASGRTRVVTRLPPVPNPLFPGVGGPVAEPVPSGLGMAENGDLLVPVLVGFPFPAGASSVLRIDPETGAFAVEVSGLTSAIEVREIRGDLYVLEVSGDLLTGVPGRLLRFTSADAAPEVLAGGLIGAVGLDHDPVRDELVVSELFTGLLKRISIGG